MDTTNMTARSPERDSLPLQTLKHHVTGAIERGEKEAIIGQAVARKQWRYYSYDVWGNAKDGYEVNNVFRTSDVIEIPDSVKTDAELFAHLKRIGFINKPYLRASKFETDANVMADDVIYFSYNGRPEGEFRLESVE